MSEKDEKKIEQLFEEISRLEPSPDIVTRDLKRIRQSLTEQVNVHERVRQKIWTIIAGSKVTKTAVAAVLLIAAGLFFIHDRPAIQTQDHAQVEAVKPPIEMIKAKSLNLAYRSGGMEAVERQYDEAFKNEGPRPAKLTIQDVFAEFNGS